jgi:2-amino-4-hydroxy-6-hydroxymethyldihydropteridine diphosphokinase
MNTDVHIAYIGLGSNLGDRAGNLLAAIRCLMEASLAVEKLSCIYETEPVGMEGGPFLNMVAEVSVRDISPTQMMARLLRIEYLLDRRDKGEKRPRTIDLDLLFYGETRLTTEFLTLPHPRLHLRKFVLHPLHEIAPSFRHPAMKCMISELFEKCDDASWVRRWDPNAEIAHELAELSA